MTLEGPTPTVIGNPVRRDLLLRSMRSNTNATAIAVWSILVTLVGVVVLVRQLGLGRPFDPGDGDPRAVGRALGQWWIVANVAGVCVVAPVLTAVACAGTGANRRFTGWTATLVGPWRVVTGLLQQQLALLLLALTTTIPVAVVAWSLGGTNLAQLATGFAGAVVTGAVAITLTMSIACRSDHVGRPLAVALVLVAALHVVPFVVHQEHRGAGGDPVPGVVPVVAVADAASPRAPTPSTPTGAADAPLDHLRAVLPTSPATIPPWGRTVAGAAVVASAALVVTRLRIGRAAHH